MTTSPVTSTGIAEFISARLGEEEALARAATAGRWEVVDYDDEVATEGFEVRSDQSPGGRPRTEFRWVIDHDGVYERADAEHIAAHGPARVLADIAAKRRLLEIWQQMHDHTSDDFTTNSFADEILEQLLAPYGKRAVFTRMGNSGPLSWHLQDVEVAADV